MAFPESSPRRWLDEIRNLSKGHAGAWRLVSESPPVAEGVVVATGGAERYRLAWPPEFPFRPPTVWHLDADGAVVDHSATGHRLADGSVCLFGHRPADGWRADFTAATAVDQLRLFIAATDRSLFPRAEGRPLKLEHIRVSMHPRLMEAIRSNAGWGLMFGWHRRDGRFLLIAKTEMTSASGLTIGDVEEVPPQPWGSALGLAVPWNGIWCKIDEGLGTVPPDRPRLAEWLRTKVPDESARRLILAHGFVLLVGDDDAWFVWLDPPEPLRKAAESIGAGALFIVPVVEDLLAKLFTRSDSRFVNADRLRSAHVAVVGCGSLGGSVALALAKAGITRFTLFDPENLEPENVVRHVGGVFDLGIPKVEAVARAIRRTNPAAEVVLVPSGLSLDPAGWGVDSMSHLNQVLSCENSVVVCTTATADAERMVNAACVAARSPSVFAAVLGRAEHGRVFRVVPGSTPCYQCILMAQADEPGRYPRFEAVDIGVPAYNQPGIPGLAIDVEAVALLAARLALQTLALRVEGGIGYAPAHGDHVLWSAVGDWAVDGPLQTRIERISRRSDCPVCGEDVGGPLSDGEHAELRALLYRTAPEPIVTG